MAIKSLKLCVENKCVEIDDYYQPFAKVYNRVEDEYLCVSKEGRCFIKEGKKGLTVQADHRDDFELLGLLKGVERWADEEQRNLLKNFIVGLDLPNFIDFHRVCIVSSHCEQTPVGEEVQQYNQFYDKWHDAMADYFGVAAERFFHSVYLIYGMRAPFGGIAAGHVTSEGGSPAVWLYPEYVSNDGMGRLPPIRGKSTKENIAVHELTHAYLLKIGGGRLPLWLDEVLAYGVCHGKYYADDIPRGFYENLSMLPLEDVIKVASWPERGDSSKQYGDRFFSFNLTQTLGDILLKEDPNAVKKIGKRIFSADYKTMPEEERKVF